MLLRSFAIHVVTNSNPTFMLNSRRSWIVILFLTISCAYAATNSEIVPPVATLPVGTNQSQILTPGSFPTPVGIQNGVQFSVWQFLPVLISPLLIAGLKLLTDKLPSSLLPPLASIIGGLCDVALWELGKVNSVGVGFLSGAAGVALREAIDQIKQAVQKSKSQDQPIANPENDPKTVEPVKSSSQP